MKLVVKNFGKIGNVVIDNSGMTVIAGINNTGKSTLGKIVFAIVDSLNNIADKIETEKRKELRYACSSVIRNFFVHRKFIDDNRFWTNNKLQVLSMNISKRIIVNLDKNIEPANIQRIVKETFDKNNMELNRDDLDYIVNFVAEKAQEIAELSDSLIVREIINRNFNDIFRGQINYLNDLDEEAIVELVINDKKCSIKFQNNECTSFDSEFVIMNDVFYLDNPFIVDEIDGYIGDNRLKSKLIEKLRDASNEANEGLISSVIAKEKLVEINAVLDKVVCGKINYEDYDDGLMLQVDKFEKPLKMSNLSTGLKSFVIIKFLLEKGILKSKDILILDEPEVHLHPEWQQIYAQIIVLLQKYFDMRIIITTHSSNFLEAIEYYSKRNKLYEKCNFYLASVKNDRSCFENVTSDAGVIYRQMVESSIRLDRLNYEMEEENEE